MKVAYLDQNKWIALAQAAKRPAENPDTFELLKLLVQAAEAQRLIIPLTQTNIYETHKVNDAGRRFDLAQTQAILSQGKVFRGRHRRLEVEIVNAMRKSFALDALPLPERWCISDVFFEASAEWSDPRIAGLVPQVVYEAAKRNPAGALFDYLMSAEDDNRRTATRAFTDGCQRVAAQIEARRNRDATETISMKRRIYSATLIAGELELITSFINQSGLPTNDVRDVMERCVLNLVTDTPTYHVECELTLKVEAQNRLITENDMRDMQTFCTVIPYANIVVAENNFTNMARQAKLDREYNVSLTTNLSEMRDLLT